MQINKVCGRSKMTTEGNNAVPSSEILRQMVGGGVVAIIRSFTLKFKRVSPSSDITT